MPVQLRSIIHMHVKVGVIPDIPAVSDRNNAPAHQLREHIAPPWRLHSVGVEIFVFKHIIGRCAVQR